MKRYVLIVALCVVSRAATGDSWQLQQIFTNRSFGTIAFNGDQYLCLEGMQVAGASKNLTDEERRAQPHAGGLFTFRVDVPGLAQPPFGG